MKNFQKSKEVVRNYIDEFDTAHVDHLEKVLAKHTSPEYHWRGMHPFYEQEGIKSVIGSFWRPFKKSFAPVQRREDIFFAGENACDEGKSQWVVSKGNFLGLFDRDWLGIPSTGKMAFLSYVEFHRVNENYKIAETALFCDVIGIMDQAGQYPLPPMTGASFLYPGPKTQDGLLLEVQDHEESLLTSKIMKQMVDDLDVLNKSGRCDCPKDILLRSWTEDMVWYGPSGIGSSYTIDRYQQQHQLPFRNNLSNKVFNGHVARIAEGKYGGFFGWPNLYNKNMGGFLGLTKSEVHAPMRIVDIYRREGNKLAENWVYIDILHYLYEQGLDVLERMKSLNKNRGVTE